MVSTRSAVRRCRHPPESSIPPGTSTNKTAPPPEQLHDQRAGREQPVVRALRAGHTRNLPSFALRTERAARRAIEHRSPDRGTTQPPDHGITSTATIKFGIASFQVHAARRGVAAITTVTVASILSAPPAESRDAVRACGATDVTRSMATVDPSVWQAPFLELPGLTIRCGDGRAYGAVHVEVKHNVPNWADATTCITKVMARNTPTPEDGKNVYRYSFGDQRVTVSTGRNGLVTAFPNSNAHQSWIDCSLS
jgi:hypothetical protein